MPDQKQTLSLEQALQLALQHHAAGHLPQAENICQQILQHEPNTPSALHLLGLISHQLGKNDEAIEAITKAVTLEPEMAPAHGNLGIVLQSVGRLDDAVASYRAALRLKPDYVEAYYNLGNALRELGELEDSAANYRKVIDLRPDYVEAHHNLGAALQELGNVEEAATSYRQAVALAPNMAQAHYSLANALQQLGKLTEAEASYRQALAIDPNYANAHNNLGRTLQQSGKLEEAEASYRRALEINPDYADACNNLGHALSEMGKPADAVAWYRRAVALAPQSGVFRENFATSLETVSFDSVDDSLYPDLLQALELPTVRPAEITRAVFSALRHHADFAQILTATASATPDTEFSHNTIAEQLSAIPLLLHILALSPISDLEIERMLTALRRAMVRETTQGTAEEQVTPFSAALALQCFTNEYVFAESDAETEAVETLQRQVAELLENGQQVPPSCVVALGAYRPLYRFSWAQALGEQKWPEAIARVIQTQILEPLEERGLRDQIPSATDIQNTVSQSVRDQYEENPYPRWIKTGIADQGKAIGDTLQGPPYDFELGDYVSPEQPEILIAGCGTGQHALSTATKYLNARVLAVDLSLSSLSYAKRKTQEFGVRNIEYVQGDILELGQLDRQFDLIESVGVLHHLADPLAGWRVLVDLLRPGGLMKIGLYSEIARQHIVAGRSLIAEKGYSASAEDIRRCRQTIIAMAASGDAVMQKITQTRAFFSLSDCRDLLFHVQEHRFTVPQIEDALQSLGLQFLGFEFQNQAMLREFKRSHTASDALASLALWHEFELENPETFNGMYQFWCRKP